jgi:hypothetical protein
METTQPKPAPVAPQIQFPQIDDNSVKAFAQHWDFNGIKIILDNTTVKFAKDLTNQALKSYVIDLANKAARIRQQKMEALKASGAVPSDTVLPPAPEFTTAVPTRKSSIILTD